MVAKSDAQAVAVQRTVAAEGRPSVATAATAAYRPLDVESVRAFAQPYLPGPAEAVEEIGDGNLNLVFRVRGGGGSVIVKQALPYLKLAGDSWPLTLDRARIEAEALALEGWLAPGRVPRLMAYDSRLSALVMEDLDGYTVLRRGMVEQGRFPLAFRHLGAFAARTLLGSSDILLPAAEKKALAQRFHNPELCAITEDLIFTSPFIESPTNQIGEALAPYAAALRTNRAVRREAARLRYAFKTRAEAIVHGDLHTGSVMVTEQDTRVIDPEFAFPGPIAFDTGKMLGNLALAHVAHRARGNAAYAAQVSAWAHDFWESFVEDVRLLWPAHESWREAFLLSTLQESARFAGAVVCRRTVGLAGVADIRGITTADVRLRAEREALSGGIALLTARAPGSLDDLWALATEEEAYQ
jgi:5-methylthioribose kinase